MMDAYDILRLVCEQERVAPGAVCRISQRRADAHARHLCWYLMHTCQGMRQSDIAAWFDVDRRAVAWGVSRVEDRRDDPDFDARLVAIEERLARE